MAELKLLGAYMSLSTIKRTVLGAILAIALIFVSANFGSRAEAAASPVFGNTKVSVLSMDAAKKVTAKGTLGAYYGYYAMQYGYYAYLYAYYGYYYNYNYHYTAMQYAQTAAVYNYLAYICTAYNC